MCGIVGNISVSPEGIRLDPRILHHRGPDAFGDCVVDLGWSRVQVGGTRLAIVDCRPLPVPFRVGYDPAVIQMNGEVYNWRELREELSDGTSWQTRTDTEVVLRAWRRWGPKVLDRLNGMFAVAIADPRTRQVFLARDRAGEKPLFYTSRPDGFFFASEIKALPPPFEIDACPDAEVLEYDCLGTTPFRGVRRLPPGSYLLLRAPADLADPPVTRWWYLPDEVDEDMTWTKAVDELHALVQDAVRLRAAGEVPWTILVSGGLDSAITQAVLQAPRVYCCTFPEDGIDCMPLARAAARKGEVVPVTFGLTDTQEALPSIAYHLDTPATWSAVAHWFLARKMRSDGCKVVLSGEGADELFGGYTRYRILHHLDAMRSDPNLRAYAPLMGYMTGEPDAVLARMLDRSDGTKLPQAWDLVHAFGGPAASMAVRMMRVEWHTTMQVLLRMADRMMAASSMENRSPFLDYRLIELAARIPVRYKITARESKAVLREVARRLGVAPEVVEDRNKRGLVVPWNQWTAAGGSRGVWDRAGFAQAMQSAWHTAWGLEGRACHR